MQRIELELTPPQPLQVEAAVAELLAEDVEASDPWWRDGVEDSLNT